MEGLQTQMIGQPTHIFERVSSTNDAARTLAEQGAPHGTVVIAREQDHGRGRQGRSWASPPGGLWLSVLLRPQQPMPKWPRLGFAGSVAVAQALDRLLGVQVRLKWPNDLVLNGRKLGGVLLEASQGYVILGIGLNVNVRLSAFSQELAPMVTSLEEFLGHPVDLVGLTQEILRQLEEVLAAVQTDASRLMNQWRDRSMTLGQHVRVRGLAGSFEGVAEDIDDDGVLRVRTEAGVQHVIGADVSVREIREAKP